MNIDKGWIEEAKILKSPNFDKRNNEINLIVIHSISLPPSKYGSNNIDKLFLNKLNPLDHPYFKKIIILKVSSHFLIERTGVLKQFVSREDRAWHAGGSSPVAAAVVVPAGGMHTKGW